MNTEGSSRADFMVGSVPGARILRAGVTAARDGSCLMTAMSVPRGPAWAASPTPPTPAWLQPAEEGAVAPGAARLPGIPRKPVRRPGRPAVAGPGPRPEVGDHVDHRVRRDHRDGGRGRRRPSSRARRCARHRGAGTR
ncbi:hypothetical protein GCM10009802_26600 [Streptomyces synnematoformans]|uniref:Uncharacterized protein n=1 Tax=Streptomyces synnematoformans TaxID=415721 RepID=A0ABP5JTR8_9ACTN